MLEYIFFHKQLLDQFVEELERRAVPCETQDDEMGLVAAVDDELEERLLDQVDELYEALLGNTEAMFDDEEKAGEKHGAAIALKLSGGESVDAPVDPDVLKRILSVISFAELDELVQAIVEGVENPDHRPFCKR